MTKVSGIVVAALSLPTIDVSTLKLKFRANNKFVLNVPSLELYPKKLLYSFALTSLIVDVDVLNISYQLAVVYKSNPGEYDFSLWHVIFDRMISRCQMPVGKISHF